MKKIAALSLLLLTMGAVAQKKPHRGEMQRAHTELTPEQQATLQSKKMVLVLDLNTQQQKQVESVLTKRFETRQKIRATHREMAADSSKRLTPEERYARMNAHLDQEIAFQKEMKNILTESQFEQWKERHSSKKRAYQKHRRPRRQGRAMHKEDRG